MTIATLVTRFVRLTAVTGDPGAAELDLLGGTDPVLPRTGWTVSADSEQAANPAVNTIDGNTATSWQPVRPRSPHTLTVDMHATQLVSGLSYLPDPAGPIGQYRIETSMDGAVWGPATAGTFPGGTAAQTVTFDPALARYARLTVVAGTAAVAELNLLGRADPTLARTGWAVSSDSSATGYPVSNVLDGNPATFWRSALGTTPKPLPHTLIIDMRKSTSIGGLSYLPRPAVSPNGRIGRYRSPPRPTVRRDDPGRQRVVRRLPGPADGGCSRRSRPGTSG